jgi:hydroxypyruvate reductase
MAKQTERHDVAMELVWAALGAVNPTRAVARHLSVEGGDRNRQALLRVADSVYELDQIDQVLVIGAGKASAGMAAAVEALLGHRISRGWVNVRYGYELAQDLVSIHVHPAGHPIPDQAGQTGTARILALIDDLEAEDLVLVLLSGGASALLTSPVEDVTLQDLQNLTGSLLLSGASIREINSIRKHLSRVKGGQLARLIADRGAQAEVLVISDVVGNPLDTIGSGPCAPDPTTFADAWQVLDHFDLIDTAPKSIVDHLQRGLHGKLPDTPKPDDPIFDRIHHLIVADNRAAALAAAERAGALGLHAMVLTTYLEGEAREAGLLVAALAKEIARYGQPLTRPACLILGGETTVTVTGSGKGGRNQEIALSAALALDGWEDILVAALGTDGTDGPTDAAGAIITGETAALAQEQGLDPRGYLDRNGSYELLSALGSLIVTGPTGTNTNDLVFVLVF